MGKDSKKKKKTGAKAGAETKAKAKLKKAAGKSPKKAETGKKAAKAGKSSKAAAKSEAKLGKNLKKALKANGKKATATGKAAGKAIKKGKQAKGSAPASGTAAESLSARVDALRSLESELWLRQYLMRVTEFDGETVAPANGAAARADAMEALSAEHHELLTSKKSVALVHALEADVACGRVPQVQVRDELRVLARDQREACAIPTEEAAAWTRLTCEAAAVWHKAKLANDWKSFEPYLEKVVETLKRHAGYLNPGADPYDVWLDQYERGLSAKSFDAFAAQVKNTVVPLVHEIQENGKQPRASWRNKFVSTEAQRGISLDLMRLVGLSLDDVALAYTEHPFSTGFALGDSRIATHIYENDCLSNVFSIIHESGHSIYDLSVNPNYRRTCLAEGTSMGIHESQSRFFENVIGRSRAFMKPLLAVLRKHAPDVYGRVGEQMLYRVVNTAQPSLIRTEADELTYPLHIMVRYEIERMLFSGEAKVRQVPELWNKLTQEYLGIKVPDDTHGCLQDTHWACGAMGYFPTYALGSAYDAQFLAAMERDGVHVDAAAKAGDLEPVRAWLGNHIWQYGRSKDADELIRDATGESFDPKYYCDYLNNKFRALYKL